MDVNHELKTETAGNLFSPFNVLNGHIEIKSMTLHRASFIPA
jgi:hypothetical protein